jgi:chromosome segregation ATPase
LSKNEKIIELEDKIDQIKTQLEQSEHELVHWQNQYKELEADFYDQEDHFQIVREQL